MVTPIVAADIVLLSLSFKGCSEVTWHSLSSSEEMTTVQLLSTLISILCTGIVISFDIHCSTHEAIASSELESVAPLCILRRARNVTALGEDGKQRNTLLLIFS